MKFRIDDARLSYILLNDITLELEAIPVSMTIHDLGIKYTDNYKDIINIFYKDIDRYGIIKEKTKLFSYDKSGRAIMQFKNIEKLNNFIRDFSVHILPMGKIHVRIELSKYVIYDIATRTFDMTLEESIQNKIIKQIDELVESLSDIYVMQALLL